MQASLGDARAVQQPHMPFKLLDDEQIMQERTEQPHLIKGVCTEDAFILLHAESGKGKTFLALDMSLSIASGAPWQGCKVKQGPVVYIAAEGQGGLATRVEAWKQHHGKAEKLGVYFLPRALDPLVANEIAALGKQIAEMELEPALIVVDTWSASLAAGGGDEDKAKDAGRAAGAFRQLATDLKAAVLVIHHEGVKGRGRARGSSALKATADTELALTQKKGMVTLTNPKQRDLPNFEPIHLRLEAVTVSGERSSCVLVAADGDDVSTAQRPSKRAEKALVALREQDAEGATFTEWLELLGESESTLRRARNELLELGLVEKDGDGKGARYRAVVQAGDRQDRHDTVSDGNDCDPSSPPPTVTPLKGDGGGCEGGGKQMEEVR